MSNRIQIVGDRARFRCPGCDCMHEVRISGDQSWGWNGSTDLPTLVPSILVRVGMHFFCRSFVTAGKIAFLNDCSHALRNRTVDLPEI